MESRFTHFWKELSGLAHRMRDPGARDPVDTGNMSATSARAAPLVRNPGTEVGRDVRRIVGDDRGPMSKQ